MTRSVFLFLVALLTAALIPAVASAREKLVFAHYMVCCSIYGHEPSVDDLAQEIQLAIDHQIDGFVLNCGAWAEPPYYKRVSQAMFAAAERFNGRFRLFFSADTTTGLSTDDAMAMLDEFQSSVAYLRIDGKRVLTTFHATREWTLDIQDKARQHAMPLFVIANYIRPSQMPAALMPGNPEVPAELYARLTAREVRPFDGYSYFGAAGTPAGIAAATTAFGAELKRQHALFMAPVSPYYQGGGPNNRLFDGRGFSGMATEWEAAIAADADIIQIVTWNDWGESSYVEPFEGATSARLEKGGWGKVLAHGGFLAASQYYISWFKSGSRPVVQGQRVFVFYRPFLKGEPAKGDKAPHGWSTIEDRLYVVSQSDRPIKLEVMTGTATDTLSLGAGVAFGSVPLRAGAPRFSMSADGKTLQVGGLPPVSAAPSSNGNNYFATEVTFQ